MGKKGFFAGCYARVQKKKNLAREETKRGGINWETRGKGLTRGRRRITTDVREIKGKHECRRERIEKRVK